MGCIRLKYGVVIEGKTDGQARGPPNIKQPTVVQKKKKKLKKNNDYGIILPIRIPYHTIGVVINQKYDIVFGEAGTSVTFSVLKSSYNLYVKKYVIGISLHNIPRVDKFDLVVGGNVTDVPLMHGPMRNHNLIQNYFDEENH